MAIDVPVITVDALWVGKPWFSLSGTSRFRDSHRYDIQDIVLTKPSITWISQMG
jgi:hypothetical protein